VPKTAAGWGVHRKRRKTGEGKRGREGGKKGKPTKKKEKTKTTKKIGLILTSLGKLHGIRDTGGNQCLDLKPKKKIVEIKRNPERETGDGSVNQKS